MYITLKSFWQKFTKIFLSLIFIFNIFIGLVLSLQQNSLLDYGSFFASGRAIQLGINPYDSTMPTIFGLIETRYRLIDGQPIKERYKVQSINLNPPAILPMTTLFAKFNPWVGMAAWKGISAILYLVGVILLVIYSPRKNNIISILWAMSLGGFWHTVQLGQIYVPLFILIVCAILAYKAKYPIIAGICIGLVTAIKPNFAIWLLVLLAAREYRVFIAGTISTLITSLVPLIIYNPSIYLQWIEAVRQYDGLAVPGNNSLPGLFVRFSSSIVGFLAGLVLTACVIILIWKRRINDERVNHLGILLSLLTSPIAWTGYTIFALPILWLSKNSIPRLICALIFSVPFNIISYLFSISYSNYIFFGWFYGWGLLLILLEFISDISKGNPESSQSSTIICGRISI